MLVRESLLSSPPAVKRKSPWMAHPSAPTFWGNDARGVGDPEHEQCCFNFIKQDSVMTNSFTIRLTSSGYNKLIIIVYLYCSTVEAV